MTSIERKLLMQQIKQKVNKIPKEEQTDILISVLTSLAVYDKNTVDQFLESYQKEHVSGDTSNTQAS